MQTGDGAASMLLGIDSTGGMNNILQRDLLVMLVHVGLRSGDYEGHNKPFSDLL